MNAEPVAAPLYRDAAVPRIRLRLTIMYAVTLLLVLLASAAYLRLAMRDALAREFDESLRASAALVSQFFRVEVAEYREIDATLQHIAGELVFEDRAIHVHRPTGEAFAVVGSPNQRSRRALAPPVRTLEVALEPALAPGWKVVVEASAATVAAVNARLDRWIAMGIPVLVLLAAGAGWWLTGRSLRPVGQMADAAAHIAPGSGRRVPITDAGDELGRLGTRFNDLLDRLDGTLRQQRRFLADAAHELRTPLSRLRGRVELAMLPHATAQHDATSPNGLPAIHDELLRMSRLVDELLQLAQADADGDTMDHALVPMFLDDVVTDELHRWQVDAERAHLALRCSVLQEAPIVGDATQLRRLIGILLDNATRYSNRGGTIDVRVRGAGGSAILEVEDAGIGIAPEERDRLTERFYRGERARAHRSDGSGLGLAIASVIVLRHAGTMSFDSGRDGVGTLVRITIPAAPPSAAPASTASAAGASPDTTHHEGREAFAPVP